MVKGAVVINEPPKDKKKSKHIKQRHPTFSTKIIVVFQALVALKATCKTRRKKKPLKTRCLDESEISEFATFLKPEQRLVLKKIVRNLVEYGKGVIDLGTEKEFSVRLDNAGLILDDDVKLQYLGLYLGAGKQLSQYVSGLVLDESFITTKSGRGKKFVHALKNANIMLGIQVGGARAQLAGTYREVSRQGLDELTELCARARDLGSEFMCWRAVYKAESEFTPSSLALIENSNTLARYAVVSQAEGLVPVVSAIINHDVTLGVTYARMVMEEVLSALLKALCDHHVFLEGMVLQVSSPPVLNTDPESSDVQKAGAATLLALNKTLPPAIGGVMLASGGPLDTICTVLNQVNKVPGRRPYPISFCFGHVIHHGVLEKWAGKSRCAEAAQEMLIKRVKLCSEGSMGQIPSWNNCVFIANHSLY